MSIECNKNIKCEPKNTCLGITRRLTYFGFLQFKIITYCSKSFCCHHLPSVNSFVIWMIENNDTYKENSVIQILLFFKVYCFDFCLQMWNFSSMNLLENMLSEQKIGQNPHLSFHITSRFRHIYLTFSENLNFTRQYIALKGQNQ